MESYSQQVETVMQVFSRFSDKCIQDLEPPEYNKIYSWVAKCLHDFNLENADLRETVTRLTSELFQAQSKSSRLEARCEDLEAEVGRLKGALKNICSFYREDSNDFNYTIAKQALSGGR